MKHKLVRTTISTTQHIRDGLTKVAAYMSIDEERTVSCDEARRILGKKAIADYLKEKESK